MPTQQLCTPLILTLVCIYTMRLQCLLLWPFLHYSCETLVEAICTSDTPLNQAIGFPRVNTVKECITNSNGPQVLLEWVNVRICYPGFGAE